MQLGKRAPRHDPRTLQLTNYLAPGGLPPPPPAVDYAAKVAQWPMYLNDRLGDCTCAAVGHMIEAWTTDAGTPALLTDTDILTAYEAVGNYDPSNPGSDNGAVEVDVLNYWRQTGIGGHRIAAYMALEPRNTDHVKDAVLLFGGCYIGLALPVTAQSQTIWAVPPGGANGAGAPGSWGGHAVNVVGYTARGLTVVTWGAVKEMTWQFWATYCDEAYAVLSADWFSGTTAVSGFDLPTLQADLARVAG